MEPKEKHEEAEADLLSGVSDEDEERYDTARHMSGKNMTRTQKVFWWALDRYRT